MVAAPWLPDAFFVPTLMDVAAQNGMAPETILPVLFLESGLRPDAHRPGSAFSGLNQSTAAIRKEAGVSDDDSARWTDLDAVTQLRGVGLVIADQIRVAGGRPFETPAEYMGAQLAPAKMAGDRSRAKVIWQKSDGAPYDGNAALDVNGDGAITIGDLEDFFAGLEKRQDFAPIAARMAALEASPPAPSSRPKGGALLGALFAVGVVAAIAHGGARR